MMIQNNHTPVPLVSRPQCRPLSLSDVGVLRLTALTEMCEGAQWSARVVTVSMLASWDW